MRYAVSLWQLALQGVLTAAFLGIFHAVEPRRRRALCWDDEVYVTVRVSAATAARLDVLSSLREQGLGDFVSDALSWFCVRTETQLGRLERLRLEKDLRRTLEGADYQTIAKLRDLQAFLA